MIRPVSHGQPKARMTANPSLVMSYNICPLLGHTPLATAVEKFLLFVFDK